LPFSFLFYSQPRENMIYFPMSNSISGYLCSPTADRKVARVGKREGAGQGIRVAGREEVVSDVLAAALMQPV